MKYYIYASILFYVVAIELFVYVSVINRATTTLDMWKSIIWPVFFVIFLMKLCTLIIHEIILVHFLLLCFIDYKATRTYKRINKILDHWV